MIIFVGSLVFSEIYRTQKENMAAGNGDGESETENINKTCQTKYLLSMRSILTSPSVDPKNGYLSDKDILKQINGVENSCQWNSNTDLEKRFDKFRKILGNTDNKNQLNDLLASIS